MPDGATRRFRGQAKKSDRKRATLKHGEYTAVGATPGPVVETRPGRLVEPFGLEHRALVDVDLSQPHRAGVEETVGNAGRRDDDLAGDRNPLFAGEDEGCLTFEEYEYLPIRVSVQGRPLTRCGIDDDHGHTRADRIAGHFVATHDFPHLSSLTRV